MKVLEIVVNSHPALDTSDLAERTRPATTTFHLPKNGQLWGIQRQPLSHCIVSQCLCDCCGHIIALVDSTFTKSQLWPFILSKALVRRSQRISLLIIDQVAIHQLRMWLKRTRAGDACNSVSYKVYRRASYGNISHNVEEQTRSIAKSTFVATQA